MIKIDPAEAKTIDVQNYLQYAIAPRPICFASTIDKAGNVNLSPFSFFNMMSSNPPVCVFSPSRRVRDSTTKHTLQNLMEVPECVINIVNYNIVYQTSLSSTEYIKGVNEFTKAGFTELTSEVVKPPRVAESPVQMECVVKNIISLGLEGGAGNLVIAEVKLIHIKEEILTPEGKIDQEKIDLVARLGGDWYCRVTKENLFKLPKPLSTLGIGVDSLPEDVRKSEVLTGNDLGLLGNLERLPTDEEITSTTKEKDIAQILGNALQPEERKVRLHKIAKDLIKKGMVREALRILMIEVSD